MSENGHGNRRNSIRCVLGMLGPDVHTKGIRTIAQILSSAGIDVVSAGEHNRVDELVAKVRAADADFVGVSFSTATYRDWMQQFCKAMQDAGLSHVTIILGGLIHPDHRDELREMGVAGLFGPGTTPTDIISFLERTAADNRRLKGGENHAAI